MKLYGKNPVIERLKTNPKSIKKIYVQEGNAEGPYIRKKARKWSIPVYAVPRSKMIKMGRSLNTQGLLVEVEDFAYTPFNELLLKAAKKKTCLVFLDRINDPQNLGAIIRSLACLGGFAVVLPKHESVSVTEATLRVASGGENFVAVAQVANLNQAIMAAQKAGYWIIGAVVEGGEDLTQAKFSFPVALVVGSEQKGIRQTINKRLDFRMTLPMTHAKLSFNVAQAATIFCYEIWKQRNLR